MIKENKTMKKENYSIDKSYIIDVTWSEKNNAQILKLHKTE